MLYVIGYLVLVGLVLRFFYVAGRGDCDSPRVRYTDDTRYFGEDV